MDDRDESNFHDSEDRPDQGDPRTTDPDSRAAHPGVLADMTVGQAVDLLGQSASGQLGLLDPRTGEVVAVMVKPGTPLPITRVSTPRLGGMATPLGVYLHDGIDGGGAGFLGLVLTGMLVVTLGIAAEIVTGMVGRSVETALLGLSGVWRIAHYFGAIGFSPDDIVFKIPSMCLLLLFVRLLPLAGTHAAEHQVVHCVEQGVPLVPRYVRAMPRVHPRCGTNLLTGMLIFLSVFTVVFDLSLSYGSEWATMLGAIAAAPLTLMYWRRVGAFMQYWLATKPATDGQIAGAIKAAEQVFAKRAKRRGAVVRMRPLRRIWAMGVPQVLIGYCIVYGLLVLLSAHLPWLGPMLEM